MKKLNASYVIPWIVIGVLLTLLIQANTTNTRISTALLKLSKDVQELKDQAWPKPEFCFNVQELSDVHRKDIEESRLRNAIHLVEDTPYIWGGESLSGADCSGAIYLIYKLAGKPIPRLTSRQMHAIYGMPNLHWSQSREFDLVFWTFSPRRPYGHIGIMTGDQKTFYRASSVTGYFSKGKFVKGNYFDRHFVACGRV